MAHFKAEPEAGHRYKCPSPTLPTRSGPRLGLDRLIQLPGNKSEGPLNYLKLLPKLLGDSPDLVIAMNEVIKRYEEVVSYKVDNER